MTPFQAVYGLSPPTLLTYIPNTAKVPQAEDLLFSRDIILQFLKDSLTMTRDRTKRYADLKRTERNFKVGDWVFLRLQPYRQLSARTLKTNFLPSSMDLTKLRRR